jgi:branched-chain amino acid transport system permease protein
LCGRTDFSVNPQLIGFSMSEARLSIVRSGASPVVSLSWSTIAYGLVFIAAALLPLVLGEYWLKGLLIPSLVYALAALGLNLVTGYAGLISVGQAGFMAIGAFISVIAYGRYGLPLVFSLLIAGAVAAAGGAVVGLPSLRIRGLYLMVATLASQFIIIWVIQRVPWFGASSFGTVNTPPVRIANIPIDSTAKQYLLALCVVAVLTVFAGNLVRSRIGRAWMAIRDREVAASLMGISLFRYKILAFALAAFYAGVAGALLVFAWVGAANIQEFRLDLSIQILGMIIIGGLGRVAGAFLGAVFVTVLPIAISTGMQAANKLLGGISISSSILANAEHVVFGTLILVIIILEPLGLFRLFSRLLNSLRMPSPREKHPDRQAKE